MNVSRSSPRGAAAEPAAKARATNAPMKGGWLAGAMAIALIGGGCQEGSPTGAELASEAALGATPQEAAEASEPEDRQREEEQPDAPALPDEESDEAAEFDGSATRFAVTLQPGQPRAVAESLTESIGATIAREAEELGVYTLEMDVETEEAREALLARIRADSRVKAADASSASDRRPSWGFRGR